MAVNFSVQFRINEKTQSRVLRLTDTSTGFTFGKGNFSVTFSDGSTRIKTDFSTPDISASGGYVDIALVTDSAGAVITGSYKVDYVALDTSLAGYSLSRTFDFNWVKPTKNITDGSDVLLPEVKFYDNTSYTPSGSFTGVLTRTFTTIMPSNTSQSGTTVTGSGNLINPIFSGNYYEGIYTAKADVSVAYTHTTNSWLTVLYIDLLQQVIDVQRAPTQYQLIAFINTYHAAIEAYETTNDTQFDILNEEYDLVMALYSHLIARYESSTLDGSEPILEQLLDILRPYNVHTYTADPLTAFALETKSFNISDGTNTDLVPLSSTLNFLGSNGIVTAVTNNTVTTSPTYGTTSGTIAQGNDSRFHNPVTIGTANGLSLSTQIISLSSATTSAAGAMSAADKTKLDGIASGAQIGTVTSVGVSMPAAFTVSNSPVTTSGTIAITATGTTLQYIRGNGTTATLNTTVVTEGTNLYYTQARFDTAFAAKSTTNLTEGTNLYFTNLRARQAITLTTTGTEGAATYNSTTGVLNIPAYQGGVTSFNTRTGAITLTSGDVTTALGFTPESTLNKGVAGGYASLDGSGLVPSTQLPSYVDDVLEYADLASFPATGTTGKIYVALDNNKIYRWSGSAYIEVSPTVGTIWGGITGTLANQTDLQSALDAKQNTLTLTTTGTSGAATLVGATLNIPEYQGGVTSFNTRTGAITLTSSDVTTALTFTPYNATNPSAFIALTALSSTAAGLTYTNTTGVFSLTTGYAIPTTIKQSNWDDAYTWVAAFPTQTGNTGKYLTTDGSVLSWGTVAAGVTSFNTRTGAITLTSGDVTTALTYTPYPTPTGTTAQYVTGDGTLATFPSSIASASQLTTFGRNSTGATLYRGTVVYISGSTGNVPNFTKSQANGEGTSARTFGIVKDDIPNNSDGYVVSNGTIDNLDTRSGATHPFTSDTLVDGDTVYLDPTTAGYITRVKPSAPNHLVYIGKVIRTSPTNGTIVYQIQNGYELDELHDVQVGSYGTKDVLYRDTATNLWKNGSIASVLGFTPYDAANPSAYIALTALSSTATGLTYTNTTGVFSLTSGYVIPTTSSATNWDTAYTNRITTLTTTGSSGSATLSSNTLNIPTYTLSGLGGQAQLNGTGFVKISGTTISYDNSTYYLASNPSAYIALTALSSTATGLTYTNTTGVFSLTSGYVIPTTSSATNWDTAYTNRITSLTTTGSSGAATLTSNTLNIPTYTLAGLGGVPTTRTITINGTTFDLSADRTYTITPSASARAEQNFTATAGQTTFTITGGYVVGLVDVFINGARLLPTDYTATNGTTVVLGTGALLNDAVTVLNYTSTIAALPTSRDVFDYTATASQTTFTVSGGYTVGLLDVYVNGTKLTSSEVTATNGTTFVLLEASTVGNQVQAIRYNASVTGISGSGTANYVPKFTATGTIGDSIIQDNGTNIGFAVTPPTWYSNFKGLNLVNGSLITYSTNGSLFLTQNAYFNAAGSWTYLNTGTAGQYSIDGTGNHVFYRAVSGTAGAAASLLETMRITAAGNVGIGTSSPNERLHVSGNISVVSSSGTRIGFNTSDQFSALGTSIPQYGLGYGWSSQPLSLSGYYGIAFFSTSEERMRITSNGSVLIGTSSADPISGNGSLQVNKEIISLGTSAFLGTQNRSGSNFFGLYSTSNILYIFNSSVGNIGQFNATSGAYTALSDANKKKGFEQSSIGLNEVLQLKPTLYRMKTDDDSSPKDLGFIAQEVRELIPQAYSESGEGDDKFIGLNQMPLIAALTKSIQQQQTQINELKALLNA